MHTINVDLEKGEIGFIIDKLKELMAKMEADPSYQNVRCSSTYQYYQSRLRILTDAYRRI